MKRISDTMMTMKLLTDDGVINVVSANVPQLGCTDEEKERF